jgi:hypothetical protein
MLTRRRLPWNGPNAVEPQQAEFGAEPEITVRRLSDGSDGAFEKAVTDCPRGMGVLTDVERWV